MIKIKEISKFLVMLSLKVPIYDIGGVQIYYRDLYDKSFGNVLFLLNTGQIWYKQEDFPG